MDTGQLPPEIRFSGLHPNTAFFCPRPPGQEPRWHLLCPGRWVGASCVSFWPPGRLRRQVAQSLRSVLGQNASEPALGAAELVVTSVTVP